MKTLHVNIKQGKHVLIHDLNWSVQEGQCWAVLGKNGAGKSTLLRALAGLHPLASGEISWESSSGSNSNLDFLAKVRAYLPQGRNDSFSFSVLEAVISARHAWGGNYWESQEDREFALHALDLFDAAQFAQRDVRSLSGGERQRVSLATMLAQDAQYWLLDEPCSALDLAHQVSVHRVLSEKVLREKKSLILVSHDLNAVSTIATHVLMLMGEGQYLIGSAQQLLTEESLSQCLGHSVQKLSAEVEGNLRTVFVPRI